MKRLKHYWTFERCKKEALNYESRLEFSKGNGYVYNLSKMKGWFKEITKHMPARKKTKTIKWNYYRCEKEALKYNTRTEFQKKARGAYAYACRNKIIDNICSHMEYIGSRHYRYVYEFIFPDNSIYIGFTFNVENRYRDHMRNTSKIINKTNEIGHTFWVYKELLHIDDACLEEVRLINLYKSKGWNVLNERKGGGKGGNILIWTKENCRKEALKYGYLADFYSKSAGCYMTSKKRGWFEEIGEHLKRKKEKDKYWNKQKCFEVARECVNQRELKKKYPSAYNVAYRNKFIQKLIYKQ